MKTIGDGLLLEFASVVDAVRCVVDMQTALAAHNADVPAERRIEFRIGVNIGDTIIDGDDIFGDGVNVAARLQELAAPGGICVSGRVQEDVRGKLDIAFEECRRAAAQEYRLACTGLQAEGERYGAGGTDAAVVSGAPRQLPRERFSPLTLSCRPEPIAVIALDFGCVK
ncbi:adenylate/guanylate cyclase domain-containing protein [Vineibacter terrae]|uniref:adenylate/guanylate cyclase domain-containing protein n=1 Tax=Vineibacter terrae TaxID=2586908 RepID=UPI001C49BF77